MLKLPKYFILLIPVILLIIYIDQGYKKLNAPIDYSFDEQKYVNQALKAMGALGNNASSNGYRLTKIDINPNQDLSRSNCIKF